jgi:Leucine-rich repeat (LRR) protein
LKHFKPFSLSKTSSFNNNQIAKIKANDLPVNLKAMEIRANPLKEVDKESFFNLAKLKKV